VTKRRLERERGRREATADMSEDLSEGEKGDPVSDISAHGGDSVKSRLPRISSADAMETWAHSHKGKKLYIVLIRYCYFVLQFYLSFLLFCFI
jgi:sucrose-phosphate synthase